MTVSKPRYQRFDGLELANRMEEKDADPWCGVLIVSLSDGTIAQWVRFDGAIQELFDVCALHGVKDALTVGPHTAEFNNFVTFEVMPKVEAQEAKEEVKEAAAPDANASRRKAARAKSKD